MGHPEYVIPFCIRNFRIVDENDNILFGKTDNYQTICNWAPEIGLNVKSLRFEFDRPVADVPTSVFEIYID